MGCCRVFCMSQTSSTHDVAETSKKAYKDVKESGRELSQTDRIRQALAEMETLPTANELNTGPLADLNIPNGRVAARLNKMESDGDVIKLPKRPDKFTGKDAHTWMLAKEADKK